MNIKANRFIGNNPIKEPKPVPKNSLQNLLALLRDERLPKIIGVSAILFAIFCLVSFTSYLFTWEDDQDAIKKFSWGLVFNSEVEIKNWLGRLGAIIAHQFFVRWVGISSFLLVYLFAMAGVTLLFKRSLKPLLGACKISFFVILWLSTSMSFIFHPLKEYLWGSWGGGIGYSTSYWLSEFLGNFGTGTFLVFAIVVFLILVKIPLRIPFLTKKQDNGYSGLQIPNSGPNSDPLYQPKPASIPSTPDRVLYGTGRDDLKLDIINTPVEEKAVNTKINNDYDPDLNLSSYQYPSLDLLEDHGKDKVKVSKEELEKNKNQIVNTLNNYNIDISNITATIGPTVTLYEVIPAPGIRIARIKNLEDDIALSLAALGIRIIAPMPGKGTIGIEVPNINKEIVSMRSILGSEKFQNTQMELPIGLGKTISNEIFVADLAKMPHLLIAGATGQGKSVGINAILTSLLYKKHPSQLKLVLVDPKMVELSLYKAIEKHFLAKLPGEEEAIITDTKKVINTLNALCIEMDQRYELLQEARARNIKEYNAKFIERGLNPEKEHRFLPHIVLVIDEFADLIMTAGREIEGPMARLAQKARAIGIHLVIATQRPSVNIITGTIKANFPVRIAFKVASKIDSRTILDTGGAEQLIGRGDMLLSISNDIIRLQCAFIDTLEAERVTQFIGTQQGYPEAFLLPEYTGEDGVGAGGEGLDERDELFEEAAHIIVRHQQGSTSLLQRRLKLGYNRAGRLMDRNCRHKCRKQSKRSVDQR